MLFFPILLDVFFNVFALIRYVKWQKSKVYFKKYNIKQGPEPLPLVGNLLSIFKDGFSVFDMNLIRDYGKIVGIFEGSSPTVMCIDPKLIKAVYIKNSGNVFKNRRVLKYLKEKEPFDKFLSNLEYDEWKTVRGIISNTFSSLKLKGMTATMLPVSDILANYIDKLVEKDEYFDCRKAYGSYTLDIISSCCFGISMDSLNNENNEIARSFEEIFNISLSGKFVLMFIFPRLVKFLESLGLMELYPSKTIKFISKVSEEIIEKRRSKQEYRNDFIQTMVDNEQQQLNNDSSSNKKCLTTEEILSQAFLFFTAGYETTALSLGFISYNLAMNPAVQDKLCEEVDHFMEKYDNKIDYEMFNEMKYLDMVIDETMRLYPAAFRIDRIADCDFEYEGITIPKGCAVTVPIFALHRNPEIYPQPDEFIPERFSDEEKSKRENETFLPFGQVNI